MVDWDAVEEILPIGQDANCVATRKSLFEIMAGGNKKKKTLALADVEAGVRDLLVDGSSGEPLFPMIKEFSPAVSCAYKAALSLAHKKRKSQRSGGKNSKLDLSEFHAFLVALRHYLELAELFSFLDHTSDSNALLSLRECHHGRDKLLEWGIDDDKMNEKFAGLDPWTSKLNFHEFAEWCISSRWEHMDLYLDDSDDDEVFAQRVAADVRQSCGMARVGSDRSSPRQARRKVVSQFSDYDSDQTGTLSEAELRQILLTIMPDMKVDDIHRLFELADSNHDGEVDYEEFLRWVFH
mmetsp:Transcript_52142/g.96518  ORF Transcript_52142/g.96518 Transcript_52142/m.96518 type:complete len:295 (+) Transcript_52142:55-939(+)